MPTEAAPSSPGPAARALTERDLRILAWLGRFPAGATVKQVSRRFDIGENRAYRRLKQLAGASFAQYERLLHPRPGGVYLPTAKGLAAAGVELAPGRADIRTHVHDLALVDIAIELELAGEIPRTARELAGENRYAVELAGGKPVHVPDLVLDDGAECHAIEVKLGDPRPAEVRRILEAYGQSERYGRVTYFVGSTAAADRVGRVVEELRDAGRLGSSTVRVDVVDRDGVAASA